MSKSDNNEELLDKAREGILHEVRECIEEGVSVNYVRYGESALMLTAWNGHLDVAEFLYKIGANVNHVNNQGETVLMIAAMRGQLDMIDFLEKAKTQPVLPLINLCISTIYQNQVPHKHLPSSVFELI